MPGNAVREICPDQYGNLWLGTEDNGINRYSPATGEITNFSRTNPAHPLSATNIHGLLADDSRLWVGTFNTGIDLLDIPSGKSSNDIPGVIPTTYYRQTSYSAFANSLKTKS